MSVRGDRAGTRRLERALARGRAVRKRLGLEGDDAGGLPASYRTLSDALVFGEIWAREGLAIEDRLIATLCVLSVRERHAALEAYVAAALHLGMRPSSIDEIFIQAGLYAGFVTAESAMRVAAGVYARCDATPSQPPEALDGSDTDWDARGHETMAALHGERARQGYADPSHATTGALYELAIRYGYGMLWSRPGLERRQRFVCALATFTAIDHHDQLRKFARSGLAHGLTMAQVIEIVMQTAPYSGFPRALNALVAIESLARESD